MALQKKNLYVCILPSLLLSTSYILFFLFAACELALTEHKTRRHIVKRGRKEFCSPLFGIIKLYWPALAGGIKRVKAQGTHLTFVCNILVVALTFYLYLYDTFHAFWVSTCGGGGAVVSAASTTHTTKEHSISHQIFARFLIFTHTHALTQLQKIFLITQKMKQKRREGKTIMAAANQSHLFMEQNHTVATKKK